ncbi:MAG: FAD-binding oxidoreductase [Chlamydiia bacterium]|nr:FAD-binding oxidoreductase [Chlamydiia bacterium]MCP5492829.1 FAD-binding oxidoreductase [Chlamydiales bacterium]
MKVAVIGAGFAGLAACVFLRDAGHTVDLYDAIGIGGGASGAASGLLHPYPGKHLRRSERATEALEAAHDLISRIPKKVYQPGLKRCPIDEEQKLLFEKRSAEQGDLSWDGAQLTIHSGGTIFSKLYCEALFDLSQATLHIQKVQELPSADIVILAAGAGTSKLCPDLAVRLSRGQALHIACDASESMIGDGYLAVTEKPGVCHLGSTYEHENLDARPQIEEAKRLILPRAQKYLKHSFEVTGVSAGVRVAPKEGHWPIALRLSKQVFVLTGFGSRGLLYHALLAKEIVNQVNC